jgi:hypothetical protein
MATHDGRRRAAIVAVLVAIAFTAGCSESNRASEERDRQGTSEDRSTDTTTEDDAERAEVIDAYESAGDAFDEAAAIPDPEYPLEETHTGPMLDQTRRVLEGLATDGLIIEYPDDSQASETVTDVRIDGDVAYLEVCAVDDGRRVDAETGEVVAGGGVSTVWSTAAMRRQGGTWKLAELRQDERRDGVGECSGD